MFHNGMSNNERDFEMCFRVDNVILPKTGYFGVSAATGGLAGTENGGGLAGTVKPRHRTNKNTFKTTLLVLQIITVANKAKLAYQPGLNIILILGFTVWSQTAI